MNIPFSLRSSGPGRLVYGIAGWYRGAMALVLAVLGGELALDRANPGPMGWAVLGLVALCLLYQDTWVFDASQERVRHRAGLWIAARTTVLPFAAIERFRLVPMVPGTIPGTEGEQREGAAALGGGSGPVPRSMRLRKASVDLVMEGADGRSFLLDRVPAGRAWKVRDVGGRIADWCGKPLVEGGACGSRSSLETMSDPE